MKYQLYADVWFGMNFTMDTAALWVCTKLLKQKRGMKRILLAAFLGTAASMLCFFLLNSYICYMLSVHFVINPLMVFLCFQSRTGKEFFRQYFFTYVTVILFGGIMEAAAAFIDSMAGCLAAAAAAAGIIFLAEKVRGSWKKQKDICVRLLILTGERQVRATGFWDTGNQLRDPFVNRPVHIIRGELLQKELEEGKLLTRMIPFHSLGMENGLLETVTLEGMYIFRGEQPVYMEQPVFGIAREKLFQSDKYDVILNERCMEH